MNLDTIKQAVTKLLADPYKDQEEARIKLHGIIEKLGEKKSRLKEKLQEMGENDETSDRYLELDQEYQVVSKLLKKAKLSYSENHHSPEQQENNP